MSIIATSGDIFNNQQHSLNSIYRGVVEDRNDPLKLGRCKIRIIGLHTPLKDKSNGEEGIPTDELPWAEACHGLIEGSVSGYGVWAVPLQGSHVFVFFEDGHILKPRYFATVPGKPVNETLSVSINAAAAAQFASYDKAFKQSARDVLDEIQSDPNAEKYKTSGTLGKTSERYESGGKGPGTISSGKGDYGGVSYGVYQFASFNGREESCPVETFRKTLPDPQNSYFEGKTPGSLEYSAAWSQTHEELGTEEFRTLQHDYIKAQYYDVAVRHIKNKTGIDVESRCFGTKELVWSTAVQFGPSTCGDIFKRAEVYETMDDGEIIQKIYQEKGRVGSYFRSSSPSVQNSVSQRYMTEYKQNVACCESYIPDEPTPEVVNMTEEEAANDTKMDESKFAERYAQTMDEEMLTTAQGDLGFVDPQGKYPVPWRLNESDFHRLARNEKLEQTIVQQKKNRRDGKDEPIQESDGGTWEEPEPYYNAEYPDNIVLATHSGITVEIDNTPGAERFHVYHPSNTYWEVDHTGNSVYRNNNNQFEIVISDKKVHIKGNESETIEKNKKKYIKKNETMKVDKDQKETIGENVEREIGIDYSDTVGNDKTKKIGNDENIEVGSNHTENIGANEQQDIGGTKTVSVGGTTDHNSGGNHTIIAPIIHLNP